jgi:LPS export ABC transporter protein LptC
MSRRTNKIKWVLSLTLAISFGAVVWFFIQFRQHHDPLKMPLPKATANALMALSQVRQTATKDGVVQWKLEAEAAELEAGTGNMVLQAPQIDFFLEKGGQVHMTAQKGILNTRNNNMEVHGHVLLRNGRYTLSTEELDYQHAQRIITARAPVQISGQAIQLHAATMIYDLNTNQASFSGPVEGILHENPVM